MNRESRREIEQQMRQTLAELFDLASAWLRRDRSPAAEIPEPADATGGRDPDVLLGAKEVGEILGIPTRSGYELGGLARVQVGERRVRWKLADVRELIERRRERV